MSVKQVANIVGLVLVLAVNWLANALPLNGKTSGQVSDSIHSLFTPAGYVFAIWGLIYLGLTAFVVYQALPAQRDAQFGRQMGFWFLATCAFNTGWIFLWHYGHFVWTEVAMAGLLLSLVIIYERLQIGRSQAEGKERWMVRLPFSLYLAWVSVAAIANTAVVLIVTGWNGWGLSPTVWTVLMILVGGVLGLAAILKRGEVAFPLVVVWAFAGIVVRHADTPPVALAAGVVAVALVVVLAILRLPKVLNKTVPNP